MAVTKRHETGEYVLDKDYEIHTVRLTAAEEEHTHGFVELVYTQSGKGLHQIDGKEYHVKGGDLLVINYRSRHAIAPIENLSYVDIMLKPSYVNETLAGTEDLFLLLTLRDFSDFESGIIRENLLLHFEGEERKRIEMLLALTSEEQENKAPAGNLIMYSSLSILLSMVFRKMAEHQGSRLSVDDRLLAYMERNCAGILSVNEIALKCGYTPEHFSRLFKAFAGKTPTDFLTECRLDKAAALLRETDKPTETIITECGFSNRTAFFKKFARRMGATPLQFRKNQK